MFIKIMNYFHIYNIFIILMNYIHLNKEIYRSEALFFTKQMVLGIP